MTTIILVYHLQEVANFTLSEPKMVQGDAGWFRREVGEDRQPSLFSSRPALSHSPAFFLSLSLP